MEVINSFEGGLQKDLSQLLLKNNQFTDSLNIDLIVDEFNSSIVLSNAKGNKLQNTIPPTGAVLSISIINETSAGSFQIKYVKNNIVTTVAISFPTNTSHYELYTIVNNAINANDLTIYYNDNNIVLVPTGVISPYTANSTNITSSVKAYACNNHFPIGSTFINNDIYIITTNTNNSISTGDGYIWKFNYDKDNFDASLSTFKLIYAGHLNMSTYHHIPKTGIFGRYETSDIQKIWFTDFYNPIRYINVADPNIFAEDPSILSFNISFDYFKPILNSITDTGSGNLNGGVYQACYRLKKNNGQDSLISEMSNLVSVGSTELSKDYYEYIGGTGGTPKTIHWTVSDIDTNFDFIEFIVIVRETNGWENKDNFYAKLVKTEDINNRTNLTFSIDKSLIDDGEDILQEELLSYYQGAWFTHAKTIIEKDQFLVAANLKNESSNDFLNFDARAFRSKTANTEDILLTNNGKLETAKTLSQAIATSTTDDNINDYTSSSRACYYKPGTNILGGKGANIEYEFYTRAIPAHTWNKNIEIGGLSFPSYSNNFEAPFNLTSNNNGNASFNLNNNNPVDTSTSLNLFNFFRNNKNPQISGALRGYTRGEIYRFGIQFFDKTKKPLFTEWIGDIKFPEHHEPNTNAYYWSSDNFSTSKVPSSKLSTFAISHVEESSDTYTLYLNSLGIKFKVSNLQNLSSKVKGYSIVRLDRTSSDKTIVMQGYVDLAAPGDDYSSGATDTFYNGVKPEAFGHTVFSQKSTGVDYTGFFKTPCIGENDKIINTSNKVSYKYRALPYNYGPLLDTNLNKKINKFFNYNLQVFNTNNKYQIQCSKLLAYDVSANSVSLGAKYGNFSKVANCSSWFDHPNSGPGSSRRYFDIGNRCYFYILGTDKNNPTQPTELQNHYFNRMFGEVYIVNIEQTVSNQYNGNNYNSRAGNKYISTGHFNKLKNNIDEFVVFGGDTFVSLYDSIHKVPYYQNNADLYDNWLRYAQCNFIPLETDVNVEMIASSKRAVVRFNEDVIKSSIAVVDSGFRYLQEPEGGYFPVHSAVDLTKFYYSKPNPYNEVTKWPNRFAVSATKINGETTESWASFETSDVWDCEGSNGEINALLSHAQRIFFWQDKAFGIVHVNPRAALADSNNDIVESKILLGFGNKIERHDYISNITGTKHTNSIISSPYGIYWIDTNTKKLYKYSDNLTCLSDTKGLRTFLIKNFNNSYIDKPCYIDSNDNITGISSIYDNKRNKFYYTIYNKDTYITLGYNEQLDCFTGFYSFYPSLYVEDRNNLFSMYNNSIYVHEQGNFGNYYNTLYKSYIKFIVNPNPTVTKTFDNLELITQSIRLDDDVNMHRDTWHRLRLTNDYQNTDWNDLIYDSNIRRIERTWKLAIPRNQVLYTSSDSPNIYTDLATGPKTFGERIRDKYVNIELEYNNTYNFHLKTNSVKTIYRESNR